MTRKTGSRRIWMAVGGMLLAALSIAARGGDAPPTGDATETAVSAAKQPPAENSTNAAQPSRSSEASSAAAPALPPVVAAELEELKTAVQAQAEQFAAHSQELETERTALNEELSHIASLEAKLGIAPDAGAPPGTVPSPSPDSAAVSSSAGQLGSTVPAAAIQAQGPPTQGSVDRRLSDLEQRLKTLGPLVFSGDFRFREDAFFGGPSDRSLDQNLQNYRLRLNADVQVSDEVSGGFALASGNINDPTSTNQTLTGFYARKPIALDRVFVQYHPKYFKPLSLIAGKFTYPWYNTELTWDKDLNPEGLAQTLAFDLKSAPVLKRIALVGFELPFAQVAGVSLQNKSLVQTAVFGGQLQTMWRLSSWLNFSAYSGVYNFHNADPIALALAKASSKNPATPLIGLLPLAGGGGTVQDSITTTTATSVVNVNGTLIPTGVTTISNAQYASKFDLFDSLARFDVKTSSERWPIAIIGDFVQNTEACANVGNILRAPANTATTVFSQATNFACDPRQRRAYWAEAEVGRILRKHDLQFGYTRMFIEREAVLANLNYNQMYQGSNVSEHRVSAFYTARSNVIFDFIGLFGRPLNFGNSNPPIDVLKRLQFDVNYVF